MQTSSPRYARAPIIGAAFGLLIVVGAIASSASSLLAFFSLAGLMIVVGGVIAVAFMSFQTGDVRRALEAIHAMLQQPQATDEMLRQDIADIIHWAGVLNQRRARALEPAIDETDRMDAYVRYGLNMVLSDYDPEDVRTMMRTAADANYERECVPVDVLRAMTGHAPAFGMVGTLVGMVTMLSDLHENIGTIGATLGVAFLSTLYGVITARMIYMPAAARLQQEVDRRYLRCHLITEGMFLLVCKRTPSTIEDRLNGFLRPELHTYFDSITRLGVQQPRPLALGTEQVRLEKRRQASMLRLQADRT